eukprot:TRINITY_DN701_c0_g1_i2.p2 TRINITY_DN701_c0_g1~~TRINITY_DN701_c0_g1_i2.p2  ORF type:complete len:154 (-),score=49.92 TRINITY_DN701_c0_g1_i2:185-646(-)
MSRVMLLLLLTATLTVHHVQASREKPPDWDDALDGEWEPPQDDEPELPPPPPYEPPPQEQYESQEPEAWANNAETTLLWEAINQNDMSKLEALIKNNPRVIFARAEDGRGPLFWAYEYGRTEIAKLLEGLGVDNTLTDKDGNMPEQLGMNTEL